MKRLILLLFGFTFLLMANPVALYPGFSEIQVKELDSWFIEVYNWDNYFTLDDSLVLETKSEQSQIISMSTINNDTINGQYLFVIEQQDLQTPLQIDRNNDFLKLYKNGTLIDSVKIGIYEGSVLHNIDTSQSIIRSETAYEYCKDSSPSKGYLDNSNEGAVIYGHFYDKDGLILSNCTVKFYPGRVMWGEYIDENGLYKAHFSPRYHSFYSFYIRHDNGANKTWSFTPVNIDLEPQDSVEVNFYSTMTSIKPVIQSPIMLNNYPQPATDYSWFVIGNTDIAASSMQMNVYDLNGRKVDSFVPTSYQVRYDCSHLAQGTYIMSLQQNKRVLAAKKLHIMK